MYSYYMYMQCDTWNYIWWQCTHIMLPKKRIKITKVSLAPTSLSFYLLKYLPAKDSILVWKILPEFHYIYITVSAFLFGFTVDICFWQMCKGLFYNAIFLYENSFLISYFKKCSSFTHLKMFTYAWLQNCSTNNIFILAFWYLEISLSIFCEICFFKVIQLICVIQYLFWIPQSMGNGGLSEPFF